MCCDKQIWVCYFINIYFYTTVRGERIGDTKMNNDRMPARGWDPAWLWCKLAAAGPIRPLAWELPYATGVVLKKRARWSPVLQYLLFAVSKALSTELEVYKGGQSRKSQVPSSYVLWGEGKEDTKKNHVKRWWLVYCESVHQSNSTAE